MTNALTVAIQGEEGSFSHQAALGLLGDAIKAQPKQDFDALFKAVTSGAADRALVPIENSLHGSIHENYDRLKASDLHIVDETQLRIKHCLIARPGASLASIRRVASHAVALSQKESERYTLMNELVKEASGKTQDEVLDLVLNKGRQLIRYDAGRIALFQPE